ncbi:HK97 gp10 family phage protein [Brevibacillus borstelensis]|uniref:HK97 gp10 family phage protein n=1 Tax=Brevibacillus borstelensis TaxID=45462 RepID=UPI000F095DCA|nr:HK97 gp10 family phage protein [Brevibacillus borstelensis]MCM3560593.1 HK97 gp10 family phage protein [Brevibacillus borstelensis]MED1882004.1 HK97 gp10 family phage protein [Brevibacillus borstelensis]RNB56116.1 HK97 gp10 family phage protein [Brevibacillus borstelensis]GED55560.1 hypothetical protein BBO01nite_48010 [Brevibacillus borstelensis]
MDFRQFEQKLRKLDKRVPEVLQQIVYRLGEELLNAITDEILRQSDGKERGNGVLDTGTLLNSFSQGEPGNVWEFDADRNAITLEVGSNLTYAEYVNDGYTISRSYFVPGFFTLNGRRIDDTKGLSYSQRQELKFHYDPDAEGGFTVRPRTFIGRKYFDIALKNFQGGMNRIIEEMLDKELERMVR